MSKIFRASRYNLYTHDFDGNFLIANLLHNSFIKADKSVGGAVESLLLHSPVISEEDIVRYPQLHHFNMIVDVSVDELELANLKYYMTAFSNNSLDLTIIPTDACNFHCVYCYQENRDNKMMPEDNWRTILVFLSKNVSKFKRVNINWFGGEPLLAKELVVEFMKSAKKICNDYRIPLISTITTNGYELDLETFREFLKYNLFYFQITIDGIKDTHNQQRPHKINDDSFERILQNLRNIADSEKGYYRIAIRNNITNTVMRHMDEYLDELSYFAGNERFQIHWQYVKDFGGEQIHNLEQDRIYTPISFLDFINNATQRGIGSFAYRLFSTGMGLCEAAKKNAFYVDPDLKLHKCSISLYGSNENRELNNVGYIDKKGDLHIDEGKEARWLVREPLDKECLECVYFPLCFSHTCPLSRKVIRKKSCIMEKDELTYLMRYLSNTSVFTTLNLE
ncbi:MAG: radical SAM protein [Clostridium sp.]|jgi:uncharacterized protein|nr:radical SAM protein [Clostridium sp.]